MNRQTSNCGVILGFQQAFPILVYFFSGFILVMRCYVIWGRSKVVGAALLLVHIAHVVISGWTLEQYVAGCNSQQSFTNHIDTRKDHRLAVSGGWSVYTCRH